MSVELRLAALHCSLGDKQLTSCLTRRSGCLPPPLRDLYKPWFLHEAKLLFCRALRTKQSWSEWNFSVLLGCVLFVWTCVYVLAFLPSKGMQLYYSDIKFLSDIKVLWKVSGLKRKTFIVVLDNFINCVFITMWRFDLFCFHPLVT